MFAYNTSYHRSIKNTPHFLTFGIEARSPFFNPADLRRIHYGESPAAELYQRLQHARQLAIEDNMSATDVAKTHFDKTATHHEFAVGQQVLLENYNFLGKNTKLAEKFAGPFTILQKRGNHNLELQLRNGKTCIVNTSRVKPYLHKSPLDMPNTLQKPSSSIPNPDPLFTSETGSPHIPPLGDTDHAVTTPPDAQPASPDAQPASPAPRRPGRPARTPAVLSQKPGGVGTRIHARRAHVRLPEVDTQKTHPMTTRAQTRAQARADSNIDCIFQHFKVNNLVSKRRKPKRKRTTLGDPYIYSDYPETGYSRSDDLSEESATNSNSESDDESEDWDLDQFFDADDNVDLGYGGSSPVHPQDSDEEAEENEAVEVPPHPDHQLQQPEVAPAPENPFALLQQAVPDGENLPLPLVPDQVPPPPPPPQVEPEPEPEPGPSGASAQLRPSPKSREWEFLPDRVETTGLSEAEKLTIAVAGLYRVHKSLADWRSQGAPTAEPEENQQMVLKHQEEAKYYTRLHDQNRNRVSLPERQRIYRKASDYFGFDITESFANPFGLPLPTRSNSEAPPIWPLPSAPKRK
jgi:hypothetical protein